MLGNFTKFYCVFCFFYLGILNIYFSLRVDSFLFAFTWDTIFSLRTRSSSLSFLPPFFILGLYLLICGSNVACQPSTVNLSWASLDLLWGNGRKIGFMPLIWWSLFSLQNTASQNMVQIQNALKLMQKLLSISTFFAQYLWINYFFLPWFEPLARFTSITFVSILPTKTCMLIYFIAFYSAPCLFSASTLNQKMGWLNCYFGIQIHFFLILRMQQ